MLDIHKSGQGTKARVSAALCGIAFVLFGFTESVDVNAMKSSVVGSIITGVLFFGFCGAILYLTYYHKRTVDFLIDVQAELRKVVWPSKSEVRGATLVVVFSVAALAAFLLVIDTCFLKFNQLIGVLK